MSSEPRFLRVEEVLTIHEMQIAAFGGASGIRDLSMLESALGRAQNRWAYEAAPIPRLAADYTFGIARNHPFVDGNKRAAFMAAYTFLGLNGYDFLANEADVVVTVLALAAGEFDEDALGSWFERSVAPKP